MMNEKFKQLSLKKKMKYIVCCMLYPFIVLFHKLARHVKQMGKMKRRMGAGILAAVIIVSTLPGTVFALEAGKMTDCHPTHNEACGYMGAVESTPCSHVNEDGAYSCAPADVGEEYICQHGDECGYVNAAEGAPCTHKCDMCQLNDSSEPEQKCTCDPVLEDEGEHISTGCSFYVEKAPECGCTVKCTAADEENEIKESIYSECPVCGTEEMDLSLCKGEEVAPFNAERTVAKRTTCLDLQGMIIDNDGTPITPTNGVYDMLAKEGWKWDENTCVLTLNGVNIEVSGNCAIVMASDATIELIGDNSAITDDSIAIQNFGDLTISGTGSIEISGMWAGIHVDDQSPNAGYNINITGGNVNVTSTNDTAVLADGAISISGLANVMARGYWCGLQANGSGITVSGATVTAKSSNDSAIFTKGALSITDSADVTATDSLYSGVNAKSDITITDSTVKAGGGTNSSNGNSYTAIYTPLTLTIDGASDVTADGDWRGVEAGTSISIGGNAEVTAIGSNSGVQSKDVSISGNTIVEATSTAASAIACFNSISITESAKVTATGAQSGIASNGSMNLSAKNIEATGGWYGIDNEGDNASGIKIGGKLKAVSTTGHGIYGTKNITADDKADITATGVWSGIQATGDITFTGSKVSTIGNGGCGISSTDGMITLTRGSIYAKGASGYTAIRAENAQIGSEAANSKISLTGLIEKNGGKIAFCDWVSNSGKMTSWTTIIDSDDAGIATTPDGGFTNGLKEVWLAAPYTVTFDNEGTNSAVKVYPGNKVTAPETDPAKDGCHFSGWYLDSTKFDFNSTTVTKNITLKAKLDAHTQNADDGNCTTAITCSICGKVTTEAKEHDWEPTWANDNTNHWQKCKNDECTQVNNKAAHTFGQWVIDKAATETDTGSKHRDCSVCEYTEIVTFPEIPHAHTPSSEWSKNTDTHWHNCTANDGERMNEAVHTWNVGEITTPPTYDSDGEKTFTCIICLQTKAEAIPELPSNNAIVDDSTGTKVEYENGEPFDLSIVLSVTSKSQAEMDKFKIAVDKAASGFILGGLYDMKLIKDGVVIQPDGKIKVSIPLTDTMKAMTDLKVVYIDADGNVTIIPSEIKDGMIVFVTDHFSNYGVIGKVKAVDQKNSKGDINNGNSNAPQTGDNSPIVPLVLMILASGTILLILTQKKRVYRHLK